MPFFGKVFAGTRRAYTYLPESIRVFPLPDELKALLERIGFQRVTYRLFTNGIAAVHVGTKEEYRSRESGARMNEKGRIQESVFRIQNS
jgi:hypothetical protein